MSAWRAVRERAARPAHRAEEESCGARGRDPLGETPGPGRGGVSRLFPWSPLRRARHRCDNTGKEVWARPRPTAPSRVRKWCLSVMLKARYTEGADVRSRNNRYQWLDVPSSDLFL